MSNGSPLGVFLLELIMGRTSRRGSVVPAAGLAAILSALLPSAPLQAQDAPLNFREIQQALAAADCYSGDTGRFGVLAFRTAVRCWQRANGEDSDGKLTPAQEERL